MNIDFTNVKESTFTLVPANTEVRVEIIDAEFKTASTGNEMLSLKLKVLTEEYEGTNIFDNCVITEKALWRLKTALKCFGVDTEGSIDIDAEDLIGLEGDIIVNQDEYNGKKKNTVKTYKKASGDIPFEIA